jgi:hypothetical protein
VISHPVVVAAGTLAASVLSLAPFSQEHRVASRAAVTAGAAGVAVTAERLPLDARETTTVEAPAGVAALAATTAGSPALASHVRLTIVRDSDSATLFVGSLASFRSLPVAAGDKLRVTVVRDGGYRGLHAATRLTWAPA